MIFPSQYPSMYQSYIPLKPIENPSNTRFDDSPIKLPSLNQLGLLQNFEIPRIHQETVNSNNLVYRSESRPKQEVSKPETIRKQLTMESSLQTKLWDLVKASQYLIEKHGDPITSPSK